MANHIWVIFGNYSFRLKSRLRVANVVNNILHHLILRRKSIFGYRFVKKTLSDTLSYSGKSNTYIFLFSYSEYRGGEVKYSLMLGDSDETFNVR